MTNALTFKYQSFYIAFAPEEGIWSDGGCFEEAANNLAEKLRSAESAVKRGTGDERERL